VAQLQLMLRNAEKHYANPDFQRDMLETVENVVERMGKLMQQLRSGETPVEGPRPVDLGAIVRRVQANRAAGQRGLKLETAAGVMALGHEDRLERVIGHLIQNGFEAAGENAHVAVRVFREADRAVVEVADNGVGMSAEFVRDQLFKPFRTTKATGMGIGAYESQQYVMGLGGRMDVQSEPGVGTRVLVILQALEPADASKRLEQPA
jgi:putative PEP-CTERM system histidine kinase